ncbi:MAG TPA: hypothetical protein VLV15_17550, partial [Dongiaceae bacterium]|nr:hypothetical protein [Dongiaceae bacterium]
MSAGAATLAVATPARGAAPLAGPHRIAWLALGDFRERSRSVAFLVTMLAAVWAAHVFLPENGANYATLQIGGHRGVYDSAWVGSLVAMMANAFLGFAGFYLVKSAIERDRRTGVGEVLAGTPLAKPMYTLSKALSNFMVLACMIAVLGLSACALQWLRGEDHVVRPLALFAPLVWVTLPYMAMVASLAVLFEAVPGLRGGFGNVVWFFLWTAGIAQSSFGGLEAGRAGNDPMGLQMLVPDMIRSCIAAFPKEHIDPHSVSMGFSFDSHRTPVVATFAWAGVRWTWAMIAGRLVWAAVALGLALLAALPFDRFERGRGAGVVARLSASRRGPRDAATPPRARTSAAAPDPGPLLARLATRPVVRGPGLGTMVLVELRVMLRGMGRAWWLVALALVALGLFVPLAGARVGVAALAWVWPMFVWSPLGTRETRFGTRPLFASSPRPLARQLVAQWLAGVLVAVLLTGALGLRLGMNGEWTAAAQWLAGSLFVPALALGLGALSGTPRFFEALYMCLWYGGVLNRVQMIDPSGGSAPAGAWGGAVGFAAG